MFIFKPCETMFVYIFLSFQSHLRDYSIAGVSSYLYIYIFFIIVAFIAYFRFPVSHSPISEAFLIFFSPHPG